MDGKSWNESERCYTKCLGHGGPSLLVSLLRPHSYSDDRMIREKDHLTDLKIYVFFFYFRDFSFMVDRERHRFRKTAVRTSSSGCLKSFPLLLYSSLSTPRAYF